MNRESYPSDNFGLSGDIGTSSTGTLEVIGILSSPLDSTNLQDGSVPVYVSGSNKFALNPVSDRKVLVNDVAMSDDWDVEVNEATGFTVNASNRVNLKNKAILVNMFGVSDDYTVTVNVTKPITVNGV